MGEQDYVRTRPLQLVVFGCLKVRALITLLIASVLPASLIAYRARFISGKTALLTILSIVILLRVLIGKPTFYSAHAKTS